MYPIGVSSCGNKPLTGESFRQMAEAGLGAMELSAQDYDHYDFKQIQKNAAGNGIRLWSLHLPFAPFAVLNPAALEKEVREHTVDVFSGVIARASDAGIDKFVVHASGEPNAPETRESRIGYAMETLDRLAEFATAHGATVCVENLPRTCLGNRAAELQRLLSANDKLRVCFDLNHSLGEDNSAYLKLLGDRIVTLHVSDYDLVDERHWLPGEGKVNWPEMVRLLQEANYQGVWMYEVGFEPPKTIDRRVMTWQDFADNARAVLNGKTPPLLGKVLL